MLEAYDCTITPVILSKLGLIEVATYNPQLQLSYFNENDDFGQILLAALRFYFYVFNISVAYLMLILSIYCQFTDEIVHYVLYCK